MDISLKRWEGKVAVVTGASSGIGAAIAKELVNHGLNVVGLARRLDRLEAVSASLQHITSSSSGKFFPIKADVTQDNDVLAAFKWIEDNLKNGVSILVNSAGVYKECSLMNGESEDYYSVFNTNVIGPSIVTREAIKNMSKNSIDGHIIHINSCVGHAVPKRAEGAIYTASKLAVTALTEGARLELTAANKKIKITSISPGFVETEMVSNLALEDEARAEAMRRMVRLNVQDITDAIIYVLSTPPHVQVHELTIKPVGELF